MKLLPDENLPKRLKQDFPEYEILQFVKKSGTASKMESC